jgi:hypothetical protein
MTGRGRPVRIVGSRCTSANEGLVTGTVERRGGWRTRFLHYPLAARGVASVFMVVGGRSGDAGGLGSLCVGGALGAWPPEAVTRPGVTPGDL